MNDKRGYPGTLVDLDEKESLAEEDRRKQHTGQDEEEESPQFAYFGVGPAMVLVDSFDEYGIALATGGRFPFHERMALNAGVTWGAHVLASNG